jgi:tripartite-type tricarboxylate transporter receptor subunit TctC
MTAGARAVLLAIIALGAQLSIARAHAAGSYPSRPIRLIVPFAPGGGSDIVARIIGQKLNHALGQAVIVDNRSGAGSITGTEIAAKSAPDGYTMILNNIGLAFSESLFKSLPYNAQRDLAPVTLVATQPYMLVVHPSLPVRTVAELVALAKSKPGQITYASGGIGGGNHLATELLMLMANIKLVHIPYKGTGPSLTDLIGGQVQLTLSTLASVLPHVRSGKLRALGVSGKSRAAAAPDVATISEAGVPGYESNTWYGILFPAATPQPLIQKMNGEIRRILATPDVQAKFEAQGLDAVSTTPAQFADYLKAEIVKWARVVKASGATAE